MKKTILLLAILTASHFFSHAQTTNTYPFPASGSVGIGTTTPATTLDVVGGGRFSGNAQPASGTGTEVFYSGGSGYIQAFNRTAVTFVPMNIQGSTIGFSNTGVASTNPNLLISGGNVGIGTPSFLTVNASATLFPSAVPKLDIVTNTSSTTYSELVSIRHSVIGSDAVSRQLGLIFKLSNESSTGESNKMGGMLVESSQVYANYPSLSLLTNNVRRLTISSSGNVGIGTTDNANWMLQSSPYILNVNGSAIATSMVVKLNTNWPDYVFTPSYLLPKLADIKTYIDEYHHLPEMPSAEDVTKQGLNLGETDRLLTKKVEELTLYLIDKDKQLASQQQQIAAQQKTIENVQQQLQELALQLKTLQAEKNK